MPTKSSRNKKKSGKPPNSDLEDELYKLHLAQKESTTTSLIAIGALMSARASDEASVRDLSSHTEGFYQEIDKLAKGKAMIEVTDRTLQEANLIMADAKRIVTDDAYLNRTHEFVAAGDNPVYPDVLVAIRAVQQSLKRYELRIRQVAAEQSGILIELKTILSALSLRGDGEEEVSKATLFRVMGQEPSYKWLVKVGYGDDAYFNFEKLESVGPPIVQMPESKTENDKRESRQFALGSGE